MTQSPNRPAPAALTGPRARASYEYVLPILDRLREAGREALLVGGGVRDLLIDREVNDWDVATDALPEDLLELWPKAIPTGLRHGTITVLTDRGPVEVTTFRAEGPYSDRRRPDWVRFGVSLADDLSRRDFTVNAMAFDPFAAVLHDSEGGLADLEARLLRAVGDPDRRFTEDALRPLRGIRLAAVLDFEIDEATFSAMGRAAPRVTGVARERIRDELLKLLAAERPSRGFEWLRKAGILERVIPELLEGVAMEQNRHHLYTVHEHTLRTLDASPADNLRVRLAALFHDIGKPRTRKVVEGEGTFYNHQHVGAAMTREILGRLRFPRREVEGVAHLVDQHMFHYSPEWSEATVRRFVRRVGRENLDDLFRLREADTRGNGLKNVEEDALAELKARVRGVLRKEDALDLGELAVTGEDIMEALGLPPGPEVGRVLRALLEDVTEDPELNSRAELLRRARDRFGHS